MTIAFVGYGNSDYVNSLAQFLDAWVESGPLKTITPQLPEMENTLANAYASILENISNRLQPFEQALEAAQQKYTDALTQSLQPMQQALQQANTSIEQNLSGRLIPATLALTESLAKVEPSLTLEDFINAGNRGTSSTENADTGRKGTRRTVTCCTVATENVEPESDIPVSTSPAATLLSGEQHSTNGRHSNDLSNGEQHNETKPGPSDQRNARSGGGSSTDRAIPEVITPVMGERMPPLPCCDTEYELSPQGQEQIKNFYIALGFPFDTIPDDATLVDWIRQQKEKDDVAGPRPLTYTEEGEEEQEIE